MQPYRVIHRHGSPAKHHIHSVVDLEVNNDKSFLSHVTSYSNRADDKNKRFKR